MGNSAHYRWAARATGLGRKRSAGCAEFLIFAIFDGRARDQHRKVSSQLDTKTVRERARKMRERGREFLHPGHFHV
jgi:hypothetical protein